MEQQALWDLITNASNPDTVDTGLDMILIMQRPDGSTYESLRGAGRWWHDVLNEQQRQGFGSIPIMKCPSRRGGTQITPSDSFMPGPLSDYAYIEYLAEGRPAAGQTTTPRYSPWWDAFGSGMGRHEGCLNNAAMQLNGPFTPGKKVISNSNRVSSGAQVGLIKSWAPPCGMERWADGTSNQLIWGEKHIPQNKIGQCSNAALTSLGGNLSDPLTTRPISDDCAFYATGYALWHSAFRVIGNWYPEGNIVRGPMSFGNVPLSTTDWTTWANDAYSFGGCHSGIGNFVLGDGSTRSISSTVSDYVMCQLADVADGGSPALP